MRDHRRSCPDYRRHRRPGCCKVGPGVATASSCTGGSTPTSSRSRRAAVHQRPLRRVASGETGHRYPQFLPDGRRFLYLRRIELAREKPASTSARSTAEPDEQSLTPLILTNRQAWWDDVRDQWQYHLLLQRDETSCWRSRSIPDSAMLSGTPVPIANGVGAYVTATSGLWSVEHEMGRWCIDRAARNLPQPAWLDFEGNIRRRLW